MKDIKVHNLSRNYADKKVLKNINIEIQANEKVLLLGKNGSGKSTFLKILATLLAPTEGMVQIGMYDLNHQYEHARKEISWCPCSDRGFFPRFNGLQNLKYFCSLYQADLNILDQTLKSLSQIETLQESLKTPYYLCSSGMKQSLNLTRALVKPSSFFFFDEPFRNLDEQTKLHYIKHFESMSKSTLVFSDHDPEVANHMNCRSFKISEGTLV